MGVPRIDYQSIRNQIVVQMYEDIVRDGPLYASAEDISTSIGSAKNVVRICLRQLQSQKLVEEGTKRVELRASFGAVMAKPEFEYVPSGTYALTSKGRDLVESLPDQTYDEIRLQAAENEDWEPLEIERPDSDAEAAADAIEKLITTVKSDNGYAASEPAEREDVVRRLTETADWLRKAEHLTASAVQVYVVWPFEALASRFSAKTTIGSAAKFAASIVVAWLKSRGIKALDGLFN